MCIHDVGIHLRSIVDLNSPLDMDYFNDCKYSLAH